MNEWEILEQQVRTLQGADFDPEPPPARPYDDEWPALLFIAILVIVTLAGVVMAWPHDALPTAAQPQGWSYPWQCCSGLDCRQAKASEIGERADGYHTPSGEVIPMTDKRIRESPDGEFHWCAHQAGPETGKTICLFVPGRGS